MTARKWLIVVGGPTASGKTTLAIELAQYLEAPILSCDSRQFFREMTIGTAKPTPEELEAAPHYFVGHLSIKDSYSVGDYERVALNTLRDIYRQNNRAILVGGSGLYQKAVVEGLDHFPEVPATVKRSLEALYQKEGLTGLQEKLKQLDPKYHEEVDLQNPHRLFRALGVSIAADRPFSSFRTHKAKARCFQPIYIQPRWERALLYERINRRVDLMIESGLEAEAEALYPFRSLTALQTVGYQELFDFFDGKISKPEAIDLIKRNTRRYAKRQLTWTRRDGFWKHFGPGESALAKEYILRAEREHLTFERKRVAEQEFLHIFYKNQQQIGSCRSKERKHNIYYDLEFEDRNLEQPLFGYFLHEIYQRMDVDDLIEVQDLMQPYLKNFGLERRESKQFRKVKNSES